MKLEINKIYHDYIIKIVIFSIFLYKNQIRQPKVFEMSVIGFVSRRLPWKIDLRLNTGEKLDKETERDLILDGILNDVQFDILSIVTASFTTPMKYTTIAIDIRSEDKYENYIYS